jgi:hypothetical protein
MPYGNIQYITTSTLISVDKFNEIQAQIYQVIGPNFYNYPNVKSHQITANAGTKISYDSWHGLLFDINKTIVHQTGAGINVNISTTTPISAQDINTIIQRTNLAFINSGTVFHSQLLDDTTNSTSTRTSAWNANMSHIVEYAWLTDADATGFFALGGYMAGALSSSLPNLSTADDVRWKTIIDTAITFLNTNSSTKFKLSDWNSATIGQPIIITIASGNQYDYVELQYTKVDSKTLRAQFNFYTNPTFYTNATQLKININSTFHSFRSIGDDTYDTGYPCAKYNASTVISLEGTAVNDSVYWKRVAVSPSQLTFKAGYVPNTYNSIEQNFATEITNLRRSNNATFRITNIGTTETTVNSITSTINGAKQFNVGSSSLTYPTPVVQPPTTIPVGGYKDYFLSYDGGDTSGIFNNKITVSGDFDIPQITADSQVDARTLISDFYISPISQTYEYNTQTTTVVTQTKDPKHLSMYTTSTYSTGVKTYYVSASTYPYNAPSTCEVSFVELYNDLIESHVNEWEYNIDGVLVTSTDDDAPFTAGDVVMVKDGSLNKLSWIDGRTGTVTVSANGRTYIQMAPNLYNIATGVPRPFFEKYYSDFALTLRKQFVITGGGWQYDTTNLVGTLTVTLNSIPRTKLVIGQQVTFSDVAHPAESLNGKTGTVTAWSDTSVTFSTIPNIFGNPSSITGTSVVIHAAFMDVSSVPITVTAVNGIFASGTTSGFRFPSTYTAYNSDNSAFVIPYGTVSVEFTLGAQVPDIYSCIIAIKVNNKTLYSKLSVDERTAPITTNLGSWMSAKGYNNGVVGMSYDLFAGRPYLTIGMVSGNNGGGAPDVSKLGINGDTAFDSAVDPKYQMVMYASSQSGSGAGVWVDDYDYTNPVGSWFTRQYYLNLVAGKGYRYEFTVDDFAKLYINGTLAVDTGSSSAFQTVYSAAFTGRDTNYLSVTFQNWNNGYNYNPGWVSIKIFDSNNTLVWSTFSNNVKRNSGDGYQNWQEVYRIPITLGQATIYDNIGQYCIKETRYAGPGNRWSDYFGNGNLFRVNHDGRGNLTITANDPNSNYNSYSTLLALKYSLYYYVSPYTVNRYTQLEKAATQTHLFSGFNKNGIVQTQLITSVPVNGTIDFTMTAGVGGSGTSTAYYGYNPPSGPRGGSSGSISRTITFGPEVVLAELYSGVSTPSILTLSGFPSAPSQNYFTSISVTPVSYRSIRTNSLVTLNLPTVTLYSKDATMFFPSGYPGKVSWKWPTGNLNFGVSANYSSVTFHVTIVFFDYNNTVNVQPPGSGSAV